MDISYRAMEKKDVKETRRLVIKCFPVFYILFIATSSFKNAVLAVFDNVIVGGAAWYNIKVGSRTVGYIEFGFTHKDFQGKGIGKETYTRAVEASRDAGADYVSAIVLGDNTSSWKLFQRQGFVKAGFFDIFKMFGIAGIIKLYLGTGLAFMPGAWLWVSDQENAPRQKPATALVSYLCFSALLGFLLSNRRGFTPGESALFAALIFAVMLFRTACTAITALPLRQKYHFQLSTSGLFLQLMLAGVVGTFFPQQGRFYPKADDWDAWRLRRPLGILGLVTWLSTPILISVITIFNQVLPLPQNLISPLLSSLVTLTALDSAFFLMEEMAGHRVWQWNKGIYLLTLGVVIGLIAVLSKMYW